MSGSVNRVIIVGNLGKDPEVRTAQNGTRICNLTVATSEQWKDKQTGEKRERTEWHRVSVFNERVVDFLDRYIKKGRKVYVEGKLQTRKWTDQAGVERYTTEVVVGPFDGDVKPLDAAPRDNGEDAGYGGSSSGSGSRPSTGRTDTRGPARAATGGGAGGWQPSNGDMDDEIPF